MRRIQVISDSLLIVSQVNGSYVAKDSKMIDYLKIANSLFQKFESYTLSQVPRDQNTEADALAGLGSSFSSGNISQIPIVHLLFPATHELNSDLNVNVVSGGEVTWTKPLYDYLRLGVLPKGKLSSHGFRLKASRLKTIYEVGHGYCG